MYRGENQEQYIPYTKKDTYMHLGGVVPRVSKKGFLWGSMASRKGAWYAFGVYKDNKYEKKMMFCTWERMYRGKNV